MTNALEFHHKHKLYTIKHPRIKNKNNHKKFTPSHLYNNIQHNAMSEYETIVPQGNAKIKQYANVDNIESFTLQYNSNNENSTKSYYLNNIIIVLFILSFIFIHYFFL